MGLSENWQSEVINRLAGLNITILNPRRDAWDNNLEQSINCPQFLEQVEWELNGLDLADIILVYFAPNSASPISLLELGLYANSGKIIICSPPPFWRRGNIEVVASRYNIPLFADLASSIDFIKFELRSKLHEVPEFAQAPNI